MNKISIQNTHHPLARTAALLLLVLAAACGGSDEKDNTADGGEALTAGSGGHAAGSGANAGHSGGGATAGSGGTGHAGTSADADGGGIDASFVGEPGTPVSLGGAGNYVILAKTGISTVPTSKITGDLGLSPAAATYITGFSLTADSSNEFATEPQVTGKIYASDYAPPTPSKLTTAVSSMETALTDAAARAPDVTELGAGDIGGMTLSAGVYRWGTGLLIPTDVTLDGNATDVWIFQIAGDLEMSSAKSVFLTGGALPKNVFWQVSGGVTIGTTAHLEGVVLSQTAITLGKGASVEGRLLAQTAVVLDANTVVEPK